MSFDNWVFREPTDARPTWRTCRMKCGHSMAPREPVRREGQGQIDDPEHLLPLGFAGDTVLRVGLAYRRGNMSWRISRKWRRGGVSLESKRLVHAPATEEGTTAPAVADPVALGSAGCGSPPPPPRLYPALLLFCRYLAGPGSPPAWQRRPWRMATPRGTPLLPSAPRSPARE